MLLSQLVGVLNDIYDITKKHTEANIQIMIDLLKLLLKNKRENLNQFREMDLFPLLISKIPYHKKPFNQFSLFILQEETVGDLSKSNFVYYIDALTKCLKEIQGFSDFDRVFESLCLLIRVLCNNSENRTIYKLILKKYEFFRLFFEIMESFCMLEPQKSWGLEKQKVAIEMLELLQKVFHYNEDLGKYFRKKNLLMYLFRLFQGCNIMKTTFATELITFLLKFSVLTIKQRSSLDQLSSEEAHRNRLQRRMTLSGSLNRDSPFLEKLTSQDYEFISFDSINIRRSMSISTNDSYFYFLGERSNSENILINFPEVFKYFILYLFNECSFEIQRKLFEELSKLIKLSSINARAMNQVAISDTIVAVLEQELLDPGYPLQQTVFSILFHLAEFSPSSKQVKLELYNY